MSWIEDLVDEYPTNRSDRAIARLARVFRQESEAVMQAAVDAYLVRERFFPKVADLAPYVREAREQERGPTFYDEVRQARYGRWLSLSGELHGDDELLAFEQKRGTMPASNQVGTEWDCVHAPAIDEEALRRVREAYARCATGEVVPV